MEQTLEEKLYDLQLFQAKRLIWCNLKGNRPGHPYFQITWMMTPGGEQFRFCHINYIGQEEASFYSPDAKVIIEYAQNTIARFMTKFRQYDPKVLDADWHKDGLLADV